jgi:hypothetical protein
MTSLIPSRQTHPLIPRFSATWERCLCAVLRSSAPRLARLISAIQSGGDPPFSTSSAICRPDGLVHDCCETNGHSCSSSLILPSLLGAFFTKSPTTHSRAESGRMSRHFAPTLRKGASSRILQLDSRKDLLASIEPMLLHMRRRRSVHICATRASSNPRW